MAKRSLLLLIVLCLSSCAHKPLKELNLTECALVYNDKGEPGGQCSGPSFESQKFMPFSELQHWVAKDPVTDETYWQACYLQRAKNGK